MILTHIFPGAEQRLTFLLRWDSASVTGDDVAAITGKADIAVIGSETIRLVDENGAEAVGPFINGLR